MCLDFVCHVIGSILYRLLSSVLLLRCVFLLKYSKDGSKCFLRWLFVPALSYVLTFCHSFYVSQQKNIQGVSTVGCGGQLSLLLVPRGSSGALKKYFPIFWHIFMIILLFRYFPWFPRRSRGAVKKYFPIFWYIIIMTPPFSLVSFGGQEEFSRNILQYLDIIIIMILSQYFPRFTWGSRWTIKVSKVHLMFKGAYNVYRCN